MIPIAPESVIDEISKVVERQRLNTIRSVFTDTFPWATSFKVIGTDFVEGISISGRSVLGDPIELTIFPYKIVKASWNIPPWTEEALQSVWDLCADLRKIGNKSWDIPQSYLPIPQVYLEFRCD